MTKVGILTGEFGQGHIALARKLKTHLEQIDTISEIKIININEVVDNAIKQNASMGSMRYAIHRALWYSYDSFATLPHWARHIHPVTLLSRYFTSAYSIIWGMGCRIVYTKNEIIEITNAVLDYDVIFSTLSTPNKLLWKNHPHQTTINVAQDYGQGVSTVWWGKFWDTHLSADSKNTITASKKFPITTQVIKLGPIYYLNDFICLRNKIATTIRILIVPGNTGNNKALLSRLEKLTCMLIQKKYQVVWKGNESFIQNSNTLKPFWLAGELEVERKGPLENLEKYHLVVGKGSFNQISESFIKGTPYAAVSFLGYWEKQNLIIQHEGGQILDWSSRVIIPSEKELISMKEKQIDIRDKLFMTPSEVKAELSRITQKIPTITNIRKITGLGPWHDFSGKRITESLSYKKHNPLGIIRKSMLVGLWTLVFGLIGITSVARSKLKK